MLGYLTVMGTSLPLDYFIGVGIVMLFIFAVWDYKLALLPIIPVYLSLLGYGLMLSVAPMLLFFYLFFIAVSWVFWLFYARKHEMSLADCLLTGHFTFCSYPLYFAPLFLFLILVPLFHKYNICCHYENGKKLVKMIPPMFISLNSCYIAYYFYYFLIL